MAKTTPVYALPYPEETDHADVPADVQALATRLDTVLARVGVPTGGGIDWYASAAPTGFLICDGSAVSRATFAALFAVIGTSWGTGDGSSTFNLPDTRGRVLVGVGTHADVAALNGNDGAPVGNRRVRHFHPMTLTATPALNAAHTLTLPNHGHADNITFGDNGHAHTGGVYWGSGGGGFSGFGGLADAQPYGRTEDGYIYVYNGYAAIVRTGGAVGNPTSNPAVNGGVTVGGAVNLGGGIGPQTNAPQDGPSYVVAAKAIKT